LEPDPWQVEWLSVETEAATPTGLKATHWDRDFKYNLFAHHIRRTPLAHQKGLLPQVNLGGGTQGMLSALLGVLRRGRAKTISQNCCQLDLLKVSYNFHNLITLRNENKVNRKSFAQRSWNTLTNIYKYQESVSFR